jgi:hypothetical protein
MPRREREAGPVVNNPWVPLTVLYAPLPSIITAYHDPSFLTVVYPVAANDQLCITARTESTATQDTVGRDMSPHQDTIYNRLEPPLGIRSGDGASLPLTEGAAKISRVRGTSSLAIS